MSIRKEKENRNFHAWESNLFWLGLGRLGGPLGIFSLTRLISQCMRSLRSVINPLRVSQCSPIEIHSPFV